MSPVPLKCCDTDCATVNGCVVGGYQCSICGGWFCKLDLYYEDGQWFCDDCYLAYTFSKKDENDGEE